MIDIIQGLQQRNPTLGPYVLVLRSDSRARDPSDTARLCAEAEAWIAEKTPGARLSQETVLIAPYPGGMPTERNVSVMAFKDAMQLAAFATAWTAEPEPDDEPTPETE
ncbi:hypothetical protein [Methylobacterium sp. Leaf93]|uniref:hypothetical protein n=1 Tax=Methylobacterium sp. Leaf93 TaxID=1736249 RepID=UPI0006FD3F6B|nr:hypothetical protein [Methylobacterium sp. Leaf93]KQP06855.1 hypothetical protein ASF26_06610 [Methylobacterium sp. Leaf93]